jgi:sulfur carrier protein ThiS
MKLRVKLHGTLCRRFPDYEPGQSVEVEIPEGGTVKDLLNILKITEEMRPVVVLEGRVLDRNDRMSFGSCVSVFQPIHGG